MSRLFTVLAVLLVASLVLTAADTLAQERSVEGKIKSWDAATSMLTLEDGTQISVPADAKFQRDRIKQGATVKASYEMKDGKNVATSLQVTPGQ